MPKLVVALTGAAALAVLAGSGCGPSKSDVIPNSTLTVPNVPPAGPGMKKIPLDPKVKSQ
jgi:hypothetical protein